MKKAAVALAFSAALVVPAVPVQASPVGHGGACLHKSDYVPIHEGWSFKKVTRVFGGLRGIRWYTTPTEVARTYDVCGRWGLLVVVFSRDDRRAIKGIPALEPKLH